LKMLGRNKSILINERAIFAAVLEQRALVEKARGQDRTQGSELVINILEELGSESVIGGEQFAESTTIDRCRLESQASATLVPKCSSSTKCIRCWQAHTGSNDRSLQWMSSAFLCPTSQERDVGHSKFQDSVSFAALARGDSGEDVIGRGKGTAEAGSLRVLEQEGLGGSGGQAPIGVCVNG
jgi:hypothetical protein